MPNPNNVTAEFPPEAAICAACSGECVIYRRQDEGYNKWCKDCKENKVIIEEEDLICK